METFSITSKLSDKDYLKAVMIGFYKKPSIILIGIFGLYLVISGAIAYNSNTDALPEIPWFELGFGTLFLVFPFLLTLMGYRQYKTNPNLQKEVTYIFSDSGVTIQTDTFKSEILWSHFLKHNEFSKFLILYHTKGLGNFIDKTNLSAEQIRFIKGKVPKK